jgi:hypothetical protein
VADGQSKKEKEKMNNMNPEELMASTRDHLALHGWTADLIGNTMTNKKYPDSKIVMTYSGGQIQAIGRNGKNSITRNFDTAYKALLATREIQDYIRDLNVRLP